ncbi:glycosyltransferase WbuB [Candidatus Atribacteria bacterium HGW-Atribacteria-1]|nr:MAG: glycosyltransferase WbuB [Candidatus Atribacteria bacterium HGW-Atribacteria-1]
MGKNIWILNHYAITPDMAGGTRHYDLGRELVKRGHKVTIFASGFDHSTKKYVKVKPKESIKIENYNGVCFIWLNTIPYSGNNWRRTLNMISYGFKALNIDYGLEKPNVVIGSSPHPFAVFAAWWISRRHKVRFIFEVRDLWPQTAVEMGAIKATGIPAKILYAWEKFMYKKAEKIIVLLPNAKDYIESLGIDPQKIVWIPNGVDLERFDKSVHVDPSSKVAKVFAKFKKKFKIVYTGAHGPANGLEVVVDATSLLSRKSANIHFFLIGDGTEKERLIRKAQEKSVDNITFLDPVPKLQIPEILGQSDLLLHCLKKLDIFKSGISPNKLYDYLASGKPIIMSAEATNNIVQDAEAGIVVEPDNPEALAQGIVKIQEMVPEERQKLGANGRAYVEKYHNTRVLADILEKIL